MTIQNYYVINASQKAALEVWDDNGEVMLGARAIDQVAPGVGLNLSEEAVDYEPGDPVSLTGMYVVPQIMMNNPDYITYAPLMVTLLRTFPWCALQDETIFAPPPEMP